MTFEQFCYWLQGFAELEGEITPERWQMIKEHLATCFNKVTPELQKKSVEPLVQKPENDQFNELIERLRKIEEQRVKDEIKKTTPPIPPFNPQRPWILPSMPPQFPGDQPNLPGWPKPGDMSPDITCIAVC